MLYFELNQNFTIKAHFCDFSAYLSSMGLSQMERMLQSSLSLDHMMVLFLLSFQMTHRSSLISLAKLALSADSFLSFFFRYSLALLSLIWLSMYWSFASLQIMCVDRMELSIDGWSKYFQFRSNTFIILQLYRSLTNFELISGFSILFIDSNFVLSPTSFSHMLFSLTVVFFLYILLLLSHVYLLILVSQPSFSIGLGLNGLIEL